MHEEYAINCYLLLAVVSKSFDNLLQQLEICYQLHSKTLNMIVIWFI